MCLALPLHRPSTSISISISIYDSLSLSLSPSLYLSPLPLPLPLPPPLSLPLPLPLYLYPAFVSYSGSRHSNQQRRKSHTATAAKCSRNCGESRRHCDQFHCDHMNRQRQPGSTMERVGHANIPWPTCRPRTYLHSEPRLRPTNGQTKARRLPMSACAPGPLA